MIEAISRQKLILLLKFACDTGLWLKTFGCMITIRQFLAAKVQNMLAVHLQKLVQNCAPNDELYQKFFYCSTITQSLNNAPKDHSIRHRLHTG